METRHLSIPLLLPNEGDCESCVARLKDALLETKGVNLAEIDLDSSRLILTFDPAILPLESLERKAREAGLEVAQQFSHETLRLAGLDCADCAMTLESSMSRLPGVVWVAVSVPASRMLVEYDSAAVVSEQLSEQVSAMGYRVVSAAEEAAAPLVQRLLRSRRLLTAGLCGLFIVTAFLLNGLAGPALAVVAKWLYLAAAAVGGWPVFRGAVASLRSRALDMNALMSIAVIGAAAIGYEGEAASVVFLFAVGSVLEGYTMERTRRALETLMRLAPDQARVKRGEGEETLPVEQVEVGNVIIIRPGERIPLDGRVVRGVSSLDESPITGESLPVQKGEGEQVWAGSINEYGSLEVVVARRAKDSTIARILSLIESAEAQKTPVQRTIDRFARYYTPAVILIAIAIALVPPLALGQPFSIWVYRALALLVVSCPCALVIATPVALVAAISAAAREGVLVKGGVYLEEVARLRAVALDKTGTLTQGKARVTDVIGLNGNQRRDVLAVAAALEKPSEHHLAQAILAAAADEQITPAAVLDFQALPGMGARARLEGRTCFVGSPRLAPTSPEAAETVARLTEQGKTAVIVKVEERVIGVIALADVPRAEAARVIARLQEMGIIHLTMLTGDNAQTAQALAEGVKLAHWRAELLPGQKVAEVKRLIEEWGKVAMVGDGINDAPALAAASVGIAMGTAGTDVALETADVVLMGDDLSRLPYLIGLSRKTIGVIRQNIAFAILVKFAFILLAVPGFLTLWLAVIGDTGVSLLVMINGMRLLARRTRK